VQWHLHTVAAVWSTWGEYPHPRRRLAPGERQARQWSYARPDFHSSDHPGQAVQRFVRARLDGLLRAIPPYAFFR